MELNRLKNDPLNDPENEYNKLRDDFIFEYGLKTTSIKTDDDLIFFEHDYEFQKWGKEQQQKINEAFKKECKRLNRDEVFYFGCPFIIYKKTYPKRLKDFLNSLFDTVEADFINGELEYLEHTLKDLENSERSGDGYSLTGYENFKLASRFGHQIGADQFTFSTNKKIEFLEGKQNADPGQPQQNEISDIENELPPRENVFFVHYQCENFNDGEGIYNLSIYSDDKSLTFSGNEAESIQEYADKVNELMSRGLVLIHWGQNRSFYGTDHINKRFKDLTGGNLHLEYRNDLNLGGWLVFNFGENYISHPRLNNLAKLNEFHGIKETEKGQRTFPENRLLLLTKIYFNALRGTLKTEASTPKTEQPQRANALQYAVTYKLDCYATNTTALNGKKTALCKLIEKNYTLTKPSPNSVYKNFNSIGNNDLETEADLINLIGDDWERIVLDLSTNKKALKDYLKKQNLTS